VYRLGGKGWYAAKEPACPHLPASDDLPVLRACSQDNTFYSPLYKSPDLLVSTFQRLDIAVTPELTQ
jgi:hypothetical protein